MTVLKGDDSSFAVVAKGMFGHDLVSSTAWKLMVNETLHRYCVLFSMIPGELHVIDNIAEN